MTAKTQLDRIAQHLTPQQAAVGYLAEAMGRFDSFQQWAEALAAGDAPAPDAQVVPALRAAARAAMKGQPSGLVAQEEDRALLDVAFLWKLFLGVEADFWEKVGECELRAALCARSLQILLLQAADVVEDSDAGESGASDSACSPADSSLDTGSRLDGRQALRSGQTCGLDRLGEVRSLLWQHLGKAYLRQALIRTIERNYFGGQPVLFPASRRRLREIVCTAETLMEEFNEIVRTGLPWPCDSTEGSFGCRGEDPLPTPAAIPPGPPEAPAGEANAMVTRCLIDAQDVRQTAAASIRREVAYVVRTAKAQALVAAGRQPEGFRLAFEAYRKRFTSSAAARYG